jgi:hypothetical protein
MGKFYFAFGGQLRAVPDPDAGELLLGQEAERRPGDLPYGCKL